MRKTITAAVVGAALLASAGLGAGSAAAAPTAAQKCQGRKNDAAGNYAACKGSALNTFIVTADLDKYTDALGKCEDKLNTTWEKLEAAAVKAGSACPSVGDSGAVEGFLGVCGDAIAAEVRGGVIPAPVLATGQTACYDAAGMIINCAGTGQDGEFRYGAPRSFTDNGNGTVTDNVTGLTWEKLSDDGSIHDADTDYDFDEASTQKIASLNSANFAGHNDWRVPNRFELESLFNLGLSEVSTYGAFAANCIPGCSILNCSCTRNGSYWSSDSSASAHSNGWKMGFNTGYSYSFYKTNTSYVRAVRGGI